MFHEEPFTSNKKVKFFTESFLWGPIKWLFVVASLLKRLEALFQCIKCIKTVCALNMFSYCALAH